MRFISTYTTPHSFWQQAVDPIPRAGSSPLKVMRRLVLEAPGHRAAILHGSVPAVRLYADLLAAPLVARRGTPMLIADATWEPGSRALTGHVPRDAVDTVPTAGGALVRRFIRTLDTSRTHYGVLSRHERERFPELWGVAPERVHFTPFCATWAPEPAQTVPGSVFAGGDSLRDYRPLIAAAPHIRGQVRVATRLAPARAAGNLVVGPMAPEAYACSARAAFVVVVALIGDSARSAGQQTYLNAMLQGQAVVVTDAPGVRDYVEDGHTGLIVRAGDELAMARAVNRLLEDRELARRLGAAAREVVARDYRPADYFGRLLSLADTLGDR